MDKASIQSDKMRALQAAWDAARNSQDYRSHLRHFHIEQLREIAVDADIGISNVRIIANGPGGRCCPACNSLDQGIHSLESEQSSPTLPVIDCTCTAYNDEQVGFCLCYYEPVFNDEL